MTMRTFVLGGLRALGAGAALACSAGAEAGEFVIVSTISQTRAASADGSRGVGGPGGDQFLWVRGAAQPVQLHGAAQGAVLSANGMSAGGAIICGHANFRPVYWGDAAAPASALSLVFGGTTYTTGEANALSASGAICVGRANVGGVARGTVWGLPGGSVSRVIAPLAGRINAQAVGVSGAGDVIVGNCWSGASSDLAFVMGAGSPELLPPLAGDVQSTIACISRDGRFGGGVSEGAASRAAVWDLTTLQAISVPAVGESAVQWLSADGAVAVGRDGAAPVLWLRAQGREENLNSLCDALGIDRGGWTIVTGPLFVSDDGRTVVGTAERVVGPATERATFAATFECYDVLDVTLQTPAATACGGGSAEFTVQVGGAGPHVFAWERDGQPIDTAANPSAATATLSLASLRGADAGLYACRVGNACGAVTSTGAQLTVCIADATCDGAVDSDDVIAFFGDWDAGDIRADVTGEGAVDSDDVIEFFARWDSGC